MKKCLMVTFLSLFTCLLLFGYFNAIEGSAENAAELLKALEDAEAAIKEANDKMSQLRTWWHGYIVEYNTITGMGLSTALSMWSPLDVSKGTVTIQGPVNRLFQLEASIFATIIYFDDLNKILEQRVSDRDTALTNYNSATSQKRIAKHVPDYYSPIPEVRLPCRNSCGVIFSSNDVGLDGLSDAAANNHKTTCGQTVSPAGCGVKHWTCDGKNKEYKQHQVLYCGKNVTYWKYGLSFSGKVLAVCGAKYRKCVKSSGVHKYEPIYAYTNGKYRKGYRAMSERVHGSVGMAHGSGTLTPPARSVNGPNPVDLDSLIDESPNCSDCIDGSKYCPNASSHSSSGGTASLSPGMSPSDGSYTVTAGSSHTATVTLGNTAIYGAYLYVNGSSQWFSGGPSLTNLSMSYTFPSDASGSYTVSALVYAYNDAGTGYGSTTTYSYTVTVDSETTTPTTPTPTTPSTSSYHACGVHETSVSGDHSLQASCTVTNGWFHSCTVTNYYACQTHTCVFPTFQCGNASCTQPVADREEHRRWCISSRKYWSCSTTQPMDPNEYHRTRICTRRKALRQVRDPVTGFNTVEYGECGEEWDLCDTRCRDVFGAVGTHTDVVETPVVPE